MIRLLSVGIAGPLERYAEGLLKSLLLLRYTPLSARNLLRVFAHLSRWLDAQEFDVGALTEAGVSAFFRSRRRAGYTGHCGPQALRAALDYLRGIGVLPVEAVVGLRTPL